jgi:tetratricopeptide (TPR) repeat protein
MKKNSMLLVSILTILSIVFLIIFFYPKPNIVKQIDELRSETKPNLDTFVNNMTRENKFYDSIENLIQTGGLSEAESVLNQLMLRYPNNIRLHILKGMLYDARRRYDSALIEYNFSIIKNANPFLLDKRAITFLKLKQYDKALEDYRKAYSMNIDYSLQLAQTFEKIRERDSALKYYKIYLNYYPDTISVLQKIKSLQSN